MEISEYINNLASDGRYSFSLDEAIQKTGKSKVAVVGALYRQIKQHKLAHPISGFYIIIPPPYQRYRCAPAEYWMDDLMGHLKQKYYVGLLSAARYYAASHQKPQVFQVVTEKSMRSIQCGEVAIQFTQSKLVSSVPTRQFNTPAGYLSVASPEALMIDLLRYPSNSGGINNIATILIELAESIDIKRMLKAFELMHCEQVIMQRLGYLFELVGCENIALEIEKILNEGKMRTKPLVNGLSTKGCVRNKRWELYINYDVEPDL